MYLKFSWHILRAPHEIRNLCLPQRIYSSHNVLTKPEVTKADSSDQEKLDEIITVNNATKLSQLDEEAFASLPGLKYSPYKLSSLDKLKVQNVKWKEIQLDTSKLGKHYLKLSKFRLTSLVVVTSMIGYAMSPSPFNFISFISCATGTGLVSSAANSINQFLEVPFDAQMSRTKNRVLVQGHLTPLHAVGFATGAASLGLLMLYYGANSLTATLGASNLILYTMVYTPLKRVSILNTWIGSIVGSIPPLMGWAACQGSLDVGAFILGGILYAWQFPHFNALSWNLRPDYSKAGYRMMAVTNPGLCRRTALRYTVGIAACSSLAPVFNLTHWSFVILSAPINLYFIYLGFKFFKQSDSRNSRKLFRFSLLHLPLLLGLMLVTKEGLFEFLGEQQNKEMESFIFQHTDDNSVPLLKNFNPSAENKQYPASQVFQAAL